MPDNLSGQQNTSAPGDAQESVTQETQSPLEASLPNTAPAEPPKDAPSQPAPVEPSGLAGAAPVQGGEQSAAVPDTEEFLKSILGDNPEQGAKAPALSPVSELGAGSKALSGSAPESSAPPAGPKMETPSAPPGTETPAATPAVPQEVEEAPQSPAIKDGTSDLDDILKGDTAAPSSKPGLDTSPEGAGGGKPISQDIVGSMSQGPASSRIPIKLIGLIILVVVIAVGGYYAYTTLVSPSSTSKSKVKTTGLASSTPATEAAATSDETRKADLANLQAALKNYYAGTGSYPVANSLILLTEETNVLTNELVTAQKLLDKIPLDPAYPTRKYGYVSDGKTFTLSAALDDSTDPGVVVEGGLNLYKVTQDTIISSGTSSESSAAAESTTPAADESVSTEGLNL